MKNKLITGSFSTGKTTLVRSLEKATPSSERIVTYDLARDYLQRNNLKSDDLSLEQKKQLQLQVVAGYIGALKQASHAGVYSILDGSLVEAYAYSQNVLPDYTMEKIEKQLMEYKNHSFAYVLPPTIPLENDGLRHMDTAFRVHIHGIIINILEAFQIPYKVLLSQSVQERTNEVLQYPTTRHAMGDTLSECFRELYE